jgi:hypothetical protein
LQGKSRLTTATADDGVETAASRRRLGDDDGDQLGDDGVEMTTASSLKKTTTTARPFLLYFHDFYCHVWFCRVLGVMDVIDHCYCHDCYCHVCLPWIDAIDVIDMMRGVCEGYFG